MRTVHVVCFALVLAFVTDGRVTLAALAKPAPTANGAAAAGAARHRRGLVVTSAADGMTAGPVGTLRSALAAARPGQPITFDRALDGAVIRLTRVDAEHTVLPGETYAAGQFAGFHDRDYGRSALYAAKNVVIDASMLPHGITLEWSGGATNRARVLAVYGDLTLINVTIRGGDVASDPTEDTNQPWTLARGGALAVWGTATLTRCTLTENRVSGDTNATRDRGAFGGGLFADRVVLTDSIVAGNTVNGFGAAGGGVYAVGGVSTPGRESTITSCNVSGNRVQGEHAYGAGVFAGGGGPGNDEMMVITNTTIARNLALDDPALPELPYTQYYYRGGGVYMTNGSLTIAGSTIVENQVSGHPAVFGGKPNMGGGGVAATIGNAHVVDRIELSQSIVAGNTVNDVANDLYTGSLINFYSWGYSRVGKLDFSQMLVPVPPWQCLSRMHWPKVGDRDGVTLGGVIDAGALTYVADVRSAGVLPGESIVRHYPAAGDAVAQIPCRPYAVPYLLTGYEKNEYSGEGAFLSAVVQRLKDLHGDVLGPDFGSTLPDPATITFTPTPNTWPAEAANAPWIAYWRALDAEAMAKLGATGGLDDAFWDTFPGFGGTSLRTTRSSHTARVAARGAAQACRAHGVAANIGAGGP